MKKTGLIIMLLLFGPMAMAAGLKDGLMLGVSGGYSLLSGNYSQSFSGGPVIGLNMIYPVSFFNNMLFVEGDISGSRWTMKQSEESSVNYLSLKAGAVLCYSLSRYIAPYGGIFFQESLMLLKAVNADKRQYALKPGGAVGAGVAFRPVQGLNVRVGCDYTIQEVSGRVMSPLFFKASLCFNYSFFFSSHAGADDTRQMNAKKVEEIYKKGLWEYRNKRIEEARKLFKEVLTLQNDHNGSLKHLASIDKLEKDHGRAMALIKSRKFFEAIPLLVKSAPYLKKSSHELVLLRRRLSVNISRWTEQGISAYEKKQYDRCIFFMNRVLLVDPVNKTAVIYLPRAIKRKQALENLK